MTPKQALLKVIELHSNQTLFADALTTAINARGLKQTIVQQNVSYWCKSPTGLPSEYCRDVEKLPLVNYQVTRHQLRPDVFGEYTDTLATAEAAS